MRALILPLLLAGCAATIPNAPSLLPRPIEKATGAEPEVAAQVATPDPALDAQIVKLGAVIDEKLRVFTAAADVAAPTIARGGQAAQGSDAWLDAQAQIAELGQARAEVDAAMTDLEALAIARASEGKLPYPALDARIDAAQVEVTKASERLELLKAAVPGI